MRAVILAGLCAAVLGAAPAHDLWLARVEPAMNAQERQQYAALASEDEREGFRTSFWTDKSVTAEEFFERATYADARFGSGQPGSGAHTDQGRVYLALGAPTNVTQLPSSRLLVPLEIWRYNHIAGLPVRSEIQLVFFQARGVGFMKLYSPQIHTIRALIINNAGTRGAFPVNDVITEGDVLNRLRFSPAEMEAVDAAMGVAHGVKGSGNSELLYRIASPAVMLRRKLREDVQTRLVAILNRPTLTTVQYRTPERLPAIDLAVQASLRSAIGVEVTGVETVETKLDLPTLTTISYRHRLYLLPGHWNVTLITDGLRTTFPVEVKPLSDQDAEAPPELRHDVGGPAVQVTYRANLSPEAPWVAIGRQYLRLNDLAHAGLCFRKALATDRRTPDALAGYGRCLALQNRLDESRELLLEALRAQPEHYESLMAMAGVTAKFQDDAQAQAYYRLAQAVGRRE